MKKLLLVPALLVSFLASISAYAVEGVAVLDMRTAMLATQVYKDAAKSLQEESEFAGNLEQAQLLQSEMQSMSEKLQKDAETLSQEEISQMQRDMQTKNKDLEFLAGKLQAKQEETADKVFRQLNPLMQKIVNELVAAKGITVLLGRDQVILADTALDLTDDVTSMLDVASANGADKK
jgi:outer membrane protein